MTQVATDLEKIKNARVVFQSMSSIYGFFFILLSAIAVIAPEVRDLSRFVSDPNYLLWSGRLFYLLVLVCALAMSNLGAGLYSSLVQMRVDVIYKAAIGLLVIVVPLLFVLSIGFILVEEMGIILAEAAVILIGSVIMLYMVRKVKPLRYTSIRPAGE